RARAAGRDRRRADRGDRSAERRADHGAAHEARGRAERHADPREPCAGSRSPSRLHADLARDRSGGRRVDDGERLLRRSDGRVMSMRSSNGRMRLVARLALDDYRHEWVLSGCSVLALAAVLIPLLVLFGLRYGIITNLLDPLIENPRYREISPVTSGRYTPEWFETMRARNDVEFVVPRTRSLAASIRVRVPDSAVGR